MGAGGVIPPQQLLHSVVLSLVRQLNYVALVKVKYDMWYDFFAISYGGFFSPWLISTLENLDKYYALVFIFTILTHSMCVLYITV